MKKNEWLPHLTNSIPNDARGYAVSTYSIALEGWRRGLKLKFINENRRKSEIKFSLSSKDKEHSFVVSRGDFTTVKTAQLCKDKHLTKQYLSKAGVPTPEGALFEKDKTFDEVVAYGNKLGYPIVIKPSNGTGGRGVFTNLKNESELRSAAKYIREKIGYSELVVEKYFKGVDHRVYVVADEVVGAFIRIPANVIGDGKSSVSELIKKATLERDKNPALFRRPIRIDKDLTDMLAEKNYDLKSVIQKGERVFLKSTANVSTGGDSVDVTDELSDEIKNIAIQAVAAIPGLKHAGIDILVDKENNTGSIIEINTQASINSHLFPMEGKARDISKALIDLYFPETKSSIDLSKPLYFFEYQNVFETFQNGYAKEYIIPPYPTSEVASTRFIVEGKIHEVGYEEWVRRQARILKLNGYVKMLKSMKLSVVVSGNLNNVNKFRDIIKNKAPKKANIISVKEGKRSSPIKVGFEILPPESKESYNESIESEIISNGYFPVEIIDVRTRKLK